MMKTLRNRFWVSLFGCLFAFVPLHSSGQAYLEHYNSKEGFSSVSKSLSQIMLKIAGSLEHHGSPEPYLRWMLEKEHPRISEKWKLATGKDRTSRPESLTDEYFKKLIAGWKGLEGPLKLQKLCRESGRYMRHAIDGAWNKSAEEWAAEELALTEAERKQYQTFLEKEFFTPAEFKTMEKFYADGAGHQKLSEAGKTQMSDRYWLGKMPAEKREVELARRKGGTDLVEFFNGFQERVATNITEGGKRHVGSELMRKELVEYLKLDQEKVDLAKLEWPARDAFKYSHLIRDGFTTRFAHIRKTAAEKDAEWAENQMMAMVEALMMVAYSELDAAIYESIANERLQKE